MLILTIMPWFYIPVTPYTDMALVSPHISELSPLQGVLHSGPGKRPCLPRMLPHLHTSPPWGLRKTMLVCTPSQQQLYINFWSNSNRIKFIQKKNQNKAFHPLMVNNRYIYWPWLQRIWSHVTYSMRNMYLSSAQSRCSKYPICPRQICCSLPWNSPHSSGHPL